VSARADISGRPTAAADPPRDGSKARGSLRQRSRAGLVAALSWLACRLPEGPAIALADRIGSLWYRVTPRRAARARANLQRVCGHLLATGRASAEVERAAVDRSALESLVRAAYRHAARYYLEVLRTPAISPRILDQRVTIETPETVERAFAGDRPVIFVAMHFGAIELPALYVSHRTGRRTIAPMETLGDPALQDWMVRTRSRVGVRIVGLREARRELLAALRHGESVGLVADRDLTGGGIRVPFFGAHAPLPAGPALLAVESGAPIYVAGLRRAERGRYRGRLVEVPIPSAGNRRERATAIVAATAQAFEDVIASAPEQWWAVFFPIWPDLRPEQPG
jgi:phosphatidylinositol dimannoside acyltransferase